MQPSTVITHAWPELPFDAWRDTYTTLHLYLQIVGKVRLAQTPWLNHSWHVTLYVTANGLSTSPIPHGARTFQIDLDFIEHRLIVSSSDGRTDGFPLVPQPVAAFYRQLMQLLERLDLPVRIYGKPSELTDVTPFAEDESHRSYDAEYANRFWRILAQSDRVFKMFRAEYLGKSSPVHFFWGAADLAVTRFSGRRAPEHPGGIPNMPDWITREAYSHEVSSAGFWAGADVLPYPVYYSYAYPAPQGFAEAKIQPDAAFYSKDLGEFLLPYDAVRQSASPDETLLQFLHTTYQAAAQLGNWDRAALERASDPAAGRR